MCGPRWFSDLKIGLSYALIAQYHVSLGALIVAILVGSLVRHGIFMWLDMLTYLGFKGSLVEMLFMPLFDMLSWWILFPFNFCTRNPPSRSPKLPFPLPSKPPLCFFGLWILAQVSFMVVQRSRLISVMIRYQSWPLRLVLAMVRFNDFLKIFWCVFWSV